jgi:ABC-type nitrate/sulfonate/bicarbonate transport system ATPase subunit
VSARYLKENNKRAILVSHSVDDLMMLADRALISRATPLNLSLKCERNMSSAQATDILMRLEDAQFRHALIALTMDHNASDTKSIALH